MARSSVCVSLVLRSLLFPSVPFCSLRSLLFKNKNFPMHPNFEPADQLSKEVIGAAIEVHRTLGFHEVRLADDVSRLLLPGSNL